MRSANIVRGQMESLQWNCMKSSECFFFQGAASSPHFSIRRLGLNLQVESNTFQLIIPLHFETLFPSATTHFRPEYLGLKKFHPVTKHGQDIISKRSLSLSWG